MNRASSRSHSVFTCVIESKVRFCILSSLFSFLIFVFLTMIVRFNLQCQSHMQWESQGVTHHRFARLNLVDLAGSER